MSGPLSTHGASVSIGFRGAKSPTASLTVTHLNWLYLDTAHFLLLKGRYSASHNLMGLVGLFKTTSITDR